MPLVIGNQQRDQMAASGRGTQSCPYADAKARGQTWVEIELTDADGAPAARQAYKITCPDGSVRSGSLDGKGWAGHYDIEPVGDGLCQVDFPGLDRNRWTDR